jgi:hypothetical protein
MNATSLWRMVRIPALISLLVTLLRLTGELSNWSERWFSKETGGAVPSGVSWVVGITWLAIPFGAYFGFRLVRAGYRPRSAAMTLALALAGLVVVYGDRFVIPAIGFPQVLLIVWSIMAVAAAIQYFGWPELFRSLVLYGVASRIPVAVVMFLAMYFNWGTHYDYVGMPPRFQMPLLPRYLWLAFFPQLVYWVGYTVVIGTLAGVLPALLTRRGPTSPTE